MQKRVAIVAFIIAAVGLLAFMLSTADDGVNPQGLDAQKREDVLEQGNEPGERGLEYVDDRMNPRRIVPVVRERPDSGKSEGKYALPNESEPSEPKVSWDDPVNQQVLGKKRWMARPSEEEVARIEAVLNEKRVDPEARALRNQDRRSAIETIRIVVDRCVELVRDEHPGAVGRVSVAFDFDTTGSSGAIKNGRIGQVWKLDEYPGFVNCVESGVAGLQFRSQTNDTVMEVEYPFFYEGD